MEIICTNEKAALAGGFQTACETVAQLSYPSAFSVKGRVLGLLLQGERLTHLDCWIRFGSARLAHHIYKLRLIGWPVSSLGKSVSTSDAGRAAIVAEYWLPASAIQAAGAFGTEYARACAVSHKHRGHHE